MSHYLLPSTTTVESKGWNQRTSTNTKEVGMAIGCQDSSEVRSEILTFISIIGLLVCIFFMFHPTQPSLPNTILSCLTNIITSLLAMVVLEVEDNLTLPLPLPPPTTGNFSIGLSFYIISLKRLLAFFNNPTFFRKIKYLLHDYH